jgi:hypothetical protein
MIDIAMELKLEQSRTAIDAAFGVDKSYRVGEVVAMKDAAIWTTEKKTRV